MFHSKAMASCAMQSDYGVLFEAFVLSHSPRIPFVKRQKKMDKRMMPEMEDGLHDSEGYAQAMRDRVTWGLRIIGHERRKKRQEKEAITCWELPKASLPAGALLASSHVSRTSRSAVKESHVVS
jgi:hypothetical protein